MFCQGSWMSIQPRVALIGLLSSILVLIAPSLESQSQESSDYSYYRVISRDSLFRPLGWTPPKKERSVLLGTVIHNGEKIAYVKSRKNINLIRVGNLLDGSQVKEISSRRLILENEDVYATQSVEFLGNEKGRSGRSSRGSTRRDGGSKGKISEGDRPKRRANASTRTTGRNFQRSVSETQRQEWREARKKFQNASSEERLRMIEKYMDRGRK